MLIEEQIANDYRTSMADAVAQQIVKCRSTRPSRSRMFVVQLKEFSWETRAVAFAIQAEEGPKVLAGVVPPPRWRPDIQSGLMESWRGGLEQVEAAIRDAFDTLETTESLRKIQTIWESVDRTSELAAARSRILLGKLKPPTLDELPDWFVEQKQQLENQEEGEIVANPEAVTAAELLVRALSASLGKDRLPEASVETGPLGRVIMDWHTHGMRLQWMIEAVDAPWPSVKVYQVYCRSIDGRPQPPESRILHNAFEAIASFSDLTSN